MRGFSSIIMIFVSIQGRVGIVWIVFTPMKLICPPASYLTRSSILVMSDGVLMLNMLR